jgi:hypothetical protein
MMRNGLLSAILITGLGFAPAAYAATTTAAPPVTNPSRPAATDQSASAQQAKPAATGTSTRAACEKRWRTEKKHTAKYTAFMNACVAKG